MKRNAIFYRYQNGEISWQAPSQYKSREDIMRDIERQGCTLATKKEYIQSIYDRVYPEIKRALDDGNIEGVLYFVRWNGNDVSRKAFQDITGVKLSPVMKMRLVQLKEYFGEKWDVWAQKKYEAAQARAKERQAEAEARCKAVVAEAEKKWNANEPVNGDQFQILCALHGIELHIRTKGYVNKRLYWVKKHGEYSHKKGAICQGFCDAFLTLKRKTETIVAV